MIQALIPIIETIVPKLFPGGSSAPSVAFSAGDIAQMFQKASADQIAWLRARWDEDPSKKHAAMPLDAQSFYVIASGGKDGKVTTSGGKQFVQDVLSLLHTMGITPSAVPATTPGSIGGTGATPHLNTNLGPSIGGLPVVLLVAVLALGAFFYFRKRRK